MSLTAEMVQTVARGALSAMMLVGALIAPFWLVNAAFGSLFLCVLLMLVGLYSRFFPRQFGRLLFALGWGFIRSAQRHAYGEWAEGRHFEYDGIQLRYWEIEDGEPLFAARDILAAIGKPYDERALRPYLLLPTPDFVPHGLTVMPMSAAADYLARSQLPEAARFRRWFEREVVYPLRRAAQARLERLGMPAGVPVEPPTVRNKAPTDDSNPLRRGEPHG